MYIVDIHNMGVPLTIHGDTEKVLAGSLVQGINSIDSLSFTLHPANAGFTHIHEKKTLVTVVNPRREEFFGRVLTSNPSMDESGKIQLDVICENCFGFFCDSEQEYVDTQNWTVTGLLQEIIDCHNSQVEEYKRFTVGNVTVTDPNNNLYIGIQRKNTWETLKEKLVDQLGGEFRYRRVNGVLYLDYLTEVGTESETKIALSHNMKSVSQEKDPSAYITRLIPLGSKIAQEVTTEDEDGNTVTETVETEQRVDISSVNGGVKYLIDSEAEAVYGINQKSQIWDDVSDKAILKTKGQNWLANNNKVKVKYTATALDLSLLGLDIDDYQVGNKHPLENSLIAIDDTVRIIKKKTDICEEVKSTIEFGDTFKTLSEIQREQANKIADAAEKIDRVESDFTLNLVRQKRELSSLISQTEEKIKLEVTEEYELYVQNQNGELEQRLTEDFNSSITQTAESIKSEVTAQYKSYVNDETAELEESLSQEFNSQITQTSQNIKSEVTSEYQSYVEDKNGALEESLTTEFNSQINQTAQNITQSITNSYESYVEQENGELRESLSSDLETLIAQTADNIMLSVTRNYESYVDSELSGESEALRQYVSTELDVLADQIVMNFSTTSEQITSVNGDMQSKFSELYSYIRFANGTITLGSSANAITLTIENDRIAFRKSGVEFGSWDGDNFYTGNIVIRVSERAQFGNFAYVPRSDGSLSFFKVGG